MAESSLIDCCGPLVRPTLSTAEAVELERLFKALADRHRVRILNLLAGRRRRRLRLQARAGARPRAADGQLPPEAAARRGPARAREAAGASPTTGSPRAPSNGSASSSAAAPRRASGRRERPLRLRAERGSLADRRGALPSSRRPRSTTRARLARHRPPRCTRTSSRRCASSASTSPARVPHRLERADAEWADVVVTMGCGDACPYIPGKRYVDWELTDPAGKSPAETRAIRDEIASPRRAPARRARRAEGSMDADGAEPRARPRTRSAVLARLSRLDRFLPLWIALAMAGGPRARLARPEPERRAGEAPGRNRLAADRDRAAADDVPGAGEGPLRGSRPDERRRGQQRALLRRRRSSSRGSSGRR